MSKTGDLISDARRAGGRASDAFFAAGSRARVSRLAGLRSVVGRVAGIAAPAGPIFIRRKPSPSPHADGDALTVLTANLWHDWPLHRRLERRLEAFARLIEKENVDVALLQEVARTPSVRVDEWLSDRLGMTCIYTRANGHEYGIGFEEGLAVLSRLPLKRPRVRQLEPGLTRFVRRLVLGAEVHTPSGWLAAYSVHLGLLPRQNRGQLESLRRWVARGSAGRPALIGGAFHADESAPQIRRAQREWLDLFRHLHPHVDGATHEMRLPWRRRPHRSRLDYLFLQAEGRRWEVLEAAHVDGPDGPHSDHRAVLARLALEA